MQALVSIKRAQLPTIAVTGLFVLFVVMLPRYTDTAKTWFVLLILSATVYSVCHLRQFRQTSPLERAIFCVLLANFLWIAFCYYANGQPERGDAFLWSRHFYLLFLIPLFIMLRDIRINDSVLVLSMFASVTLSAGDIAVDLLQGINHREQGMNPNAFGPVQLCLSGMLYFYFTCLAPGKLRRIALAGCIIGLATIILSLSKTTLITLAFLSVFFVIYLAHTISAWKKTIVVGVILILIASSYSIPMVQKRIDGVSKNIEAYLASDNFRDKARVGSFGTRMELWQTGWQIFLENPMTGVGVGGFQVMARENWKRYEVNRVVRKYKYVHNQYIAALATRGIPGLILFLLVLALPLYLAMSHKAADAETEAARLSLMLICMVYLVGCLGEDHFEGKSATMLVSVFVALLLARLSSSKQVQVSAKDASP